jgi:hypothetical protein
MTQPLVQEQSWTRTVTTVFSPDPDGTSEHSVERSRMVTLKVQGVPDLPTQYSMGMRFRPERVVLHYETRDNGVTWYLAYCTVSGYGSVNNERKDRQFSGGLGGGSYHVSSAPEWLQKITGDFCPDQGYHGEAG